MPYRVCCKQEVNELDTQYNTRITYSFLQIQYGNYVGEFSCNNWIASVCP